MSLGIAVRAWIDRGVGRNKVFKAPLLSPVLPSAGQSRRNSLAKTEGIADCQHKGAALKRVAVAEGKLKSNRVSNLEYRSHRWAHRVRQPLLKAAGHLSW